MSVAASASRPRSSAPTACSVWSRPSSFARPTTPKCPPLVRPESNMVVNDAAAVVRVDNGGPRPSWPRSASVSIPTTQRSACAWATCSPRPRLMLISISFGEPAARPSGVRAADGGDVHPRLQGAPRPRRRRPTRRPLRPLPSAATTASPPGTWSTAAAPRVVGGWLAGPLHRAARTTSPASPDPLRRRTAITAPLYFVAAGSDDDVTAGFALGGRLAGDPEPVVHNAVGIFLKHAGTRDPEALRRFLAAYATVMPRPALRLATEKLSDADRAAYNS